MTPDNPSDHAGSTMRHLILILSAALVVAACGGSATPTPTGAPTVTAAPSTSALPNVLPIFVSSEIVAGKNRFLFSLTDRADKVIAAPDVAVSLEFFDMVADDTKVVFTADARFLWAIEGERGLYVATIDIPNAGRWGIRLTATFPDGRTEQVRADFDVAATGATPAIGSPAVSVDTPTAGDVGGDLARLSSDQAPNPAFYTRSVAEAMAENLPFVLAFATPAFCTSALCGPILEAVKSLASDYPTLTFINVEPYKMVFTDGRLQPELADGQMQAADWTVAWALRSEPWIFVVDDSGLVTAKFEGVVAEDELRAAFDAVAPLSGRVSGIVVAVDQPSLTEVKSFTLRTAAGEELVFGVGTLDLTGGGFNAGHLREHLASGTRIVVDFTVVAGQMVASRLTDGA